MEYLRRRLFTAQPQLSRSVVSICAWFYVNNGMRHRRRWVLQSHDGPVSGRLCWKVFLRRSLHWLDPLIRSSKQYGHRLCLRDFDAGRLESRERWKSLLSGDWFSGLIQSAVRGLRAKYHHPTSEPNSDPGPAGNVYGGRERECDTYLSMAKKPGEYLGSHVLQLHA